MFCHIFLLKCDCNLFISVLIYLAMMDEAALGVLTEENGETHDGDVQ